MPNKHFHKVIPLILTGLLWGMAPLSRADQTHNGEESLQAVKQELAEAGRAIQGYSAAQRDKAVEQVQAALTTLDRQIDALQTRLDTQWDQLSQSARERARASLATLRQQRNEVAEWYGGMKYSSGNAWDEMKQGFSRAYTDLRESWAKAEQEFDQERPAPAP